MAKKKPLKKKSTKPKKPVKQAKRVRKPRILNLKPKWGYCYNTKKYIMREIRNGVTYGTLLTQVQWYKMMSDCVNTQERNEWLSKNGKEAVRV